MQIRHLPSPLLAAVLAWLVCLVSHQVAFAQRIGVFVTPNYDVGSWCNFQQPPGVRSGSFFVVYNGGPWSNGDYKTVRFALSIPACVKNAGAVFSTAFVLGQGNVPESTVESGVTVSLGSCRSDAVVLAKVDFLLISMPQPAGCCQVKVVPDVSAPSGMIEFTRCDDEKVYLFEGDVAGNTYSGGPCPAGVSTPPSNPSPANGATDVELNADVSVLVHWPSFTLGCFPLYGDGASLYFGTDPNPPFKSGAAYTNFPFDVGPLQPATTYYWKVVYENTLGGGTQTTPVWSFRTAAPIATEAATWGKIKSLFRD